MNKDEDDLNVTEDDITFLLRLRPAPTPPLRRRRQSIEVKPICTTPASNGWDVIIQRKHDSSPSPPPLPSKYQPSAPPQELDTNYHWFPKPYYPQTSPGVPTMDCEFGSRSYLNLGVSGHDPGKNGYYSTSVVANMVSKYFFQPQGIFSMKGLKKAQYLFLMKKKMLLAFQKIVFLIITNTAMSTWIFLLPNAN